MIASTTGIQIVIYDKLYADEGGASHKFVPDGYVSFIPEGALGKTAYGTTPEEADPGRFRQGRCCHCEHRRCHYR